MEAFRKYYHCHQSYMSGLLRYAESLFLDPRLGSSEIVKKQHTFILIDTAFLGLLLKSMGMITASF